MSTRGSGSFQFQMSLPQCESSFCRNGAVLGPRLRPVQHHWGQYLMKNVAHKMFRSWCQSQIFRGQQMRGKAGQRTGGVEHKCKHVNAGYVHTDAWNIRSIIHILQIHNLCCCWLQQRQVEDQCSHKSIQRTVLRRKLPYINDAARNGYHHHSFIPPPSFSAGRSTGPTCNCLWLLRYWCVMPLKSVPRLLMQIIHICKTH